MFAGEENSPASGRVLWNVNIENICGGQLAVWFYQRAPVRISGRECVRNWQLHVHEATHIVDTTVDFCEHAQFWPVKNCHERKS